MSIIGLLTELSKNTGVVYQLVTNLIMSKLPRKVKIYLSELKRQKEVGIDMCECREIKKQMNIYKYLYS